MESIKKYVENFKKRNKINEYYAMRGEELLSAVSESRADIFHTVISLFEFGYAKGYRAAMAEMKKKGGAAV